MTIAYLAGNESTIVMNLGGSAVASHAEKKGMTVVEAYQVRSKKAKETGEINTLKKEFPELRKLNTTEEQRLVAQVKLSDGTEAKVTVKVTTTFAGKGDVAIQVNDSYDKSATESMSKIDKLRIALKSKRMAEEVIKKIPEGVLLTNLPYGRDGGREARYNLYKSAGFTEGTNGDAMSAIVKNGKITPITFETVSKLQNAGHVTKDYNSYKSSKLSDEDRADMGTYLAMRRLQEEDQEFY